MRQQKLVQQIYNAVNTGTVKEPFNSKNFLFLVNSPGFIAKHVVGNGLYKEYFVRVARGLYKLKMEPFRKGDFIRLKNYEKYHIDRLSGREINIFQIKIIENGYVEVIGIKERFPISEIFPILINGKDDLQIYYDPAICAPTIRQGDPVPIRNIDESYYLDHFKRRIYKDRNLQEHIKEQGLQFVHEVQHFIIDEISDYGLKINSY